MIYAKRRAFYTDSGQPHARRGRPVRLLNLQLRCSHILTWPAVAADLPGACRWLELRADRHEAICPRLAEEPGAFTPLHPTS